jgi:CRP-like cAMP-binding protein
LPADGNHFSTAQAIQPSTSFVWPMATFEKLLDRFPTFRHNAVRALEQRLQEMEQRFREVSTEKVGSRLSSELVRLANRYGCEVNGYREIRLSRTDLAQLAGTTLPTVSRLLSRWQELGIVGVGRGAVRVRDVAALTQLSRSEYGEQPK